MGIEGESREINGGQSPYEIMLASLLLVFSLYLGGGEREAYSDLAVV